MFSLFDQLDNRYCTWYKVGVGGRNRAGGYNRKKAETIFAQG